MNYMNEYERQIIMIENLMELNKKAIEIIKILNRK